MANKNVAKKPLDIWNIKNSDNGDEQIHSS